MKIWPAIFVLLALGSIACAQEQIDLEKQFYRLCGFDRLFSKEEVGPDFSLEISFHNVPIAGTRIELQREGKVVATVRTNSRGVARFFAVPPGEYDPGSPDGLLFPSGSLVIEVKAGHARGEQVKMDWPSDPLSVRSLRGRFGVSEKLDDPEIPLRNAIVELRDIYTAKLIESGATDANGDYGFATTAPGVYVLRLMLPEKNRPGTETHDLAIELDPAAGEISIPEMKVFQSDCYGVELLRRSATEDGWEAQ